jgi:hypothetical protein
VYLVGTKRVTSVGPTGVGPPYTGRIVPLASPATAESTPPYRRFGPDYSPATPGVCRQTGTSPRQRLPLRPGASRGWVVAWPSRIPVGAREESGGNDRSAKRRVRSIILRACATGSNGLP